MPRHYLGRVHYDVTLKDLLLAGRGSLLGRILGRKIRVAKVLPTEFPSTGNRRPDLLFELGDGEILHIEVQAQADADFAVRHLGYLLAIREKYGRYPTQVVLWVGNSRVGVPDGIQIEGLRYGYQVLDVKSLDAEPYLRSNSLDLALFGLLCANADVRKTLVGLLRRLGPLPARQQKDVIEKLMILCKLRACREVLQKEIERMPVRIDISDEPWFLAGVEKGRDEGRSVGRIEGSRDLFTVMLEREFGKLPPRIYKRVLRATQPDIDLWVDRLKTGASLKKIFS